VSIHAEDPFATPESHRSPIRALRGRFPAAVTLWTAYREERLDGRVIRRPVGLTVSSTLVVDGTPGQLLGLLDEESDLYPAVRESGRFAVTLMHSDERRMADHFAGVVPVPGGPFRAGEWFHTPYGPLPAEPATATPPAEPATTASLAEAASAAPSVRGPEPDRTWVGCVVDDVRPVGFGQLIVAVIERVNLASTEVPLVHYRGRYAHGEAPLSA
jgi:flavin reductase (DIM6/NTAB) family NADH-FMN oxidoreductase RutF